MAKDPRSITGESFGVTDEGRLITGVEGMDGVEIDIKPEMPSFATHLVTTKEGQVVSTGPVVAGRYCQTHNLVEDDSDPDFEGLKCTNCPYGCLTKRKVEVT